MQTDKISFNEYRDLGQIFNATFAFIRQNFAILFKAISIISMPFNICGIGMMAFSLYNIVQNIDNLGVGILVSWLIILFGLLCFFIGSVLLISTVFEYINLYRDAEDFRSIQVSEIWTKVRKNFWNWAAKVILWGVLSGTLTSGAYIIMMLIMLPGIGLSAALNSEIIMILTMILAYLVFYIVVAYIQSIGIPIFFISSYEKKDVFPAIGKAFQLVHSKGNFWKSIVVTFTGNLVQYILSYSITIPITIIGAIIGFNFIEQYDGSSFSENNMVLITAAILGPLYYIVLIYSGIIYLISQAFKTGDLNERTFGTNILARIQQMGKKASSIQNSSNTH